MKQMKEDNPTKYEKHFSKFVKAGIKAEDLEARWSKTHKAIRADPVRKPNPKPKKEGKPKRYGKKKITLQERRNRIKQKMDFMAKGKKE